MLKDRDILPVRLTSVPEFAELLDAEQAELDLLTQILTEFMDELSIHSAVKTLSRYEEIFDISYSWNTGIEERRAALLTKFLTRYPMTVKRMEELVKMVTGRNVQLEEYPALYSFCLVFTESPLNIKSLMRMVRELKPAHLSFSIRSVYALPELVVQIQAGNITAFYTTLHWDVYYRQKSETAINVKTAPVGVYRLIRMGE